MRRKISQEEQRKRELLQILRQTKQQAEQLYYALPKRLCKYLHYYHCELREFIQQGKLSEEEYDQVSKCRQAMSIYGDYREIAYNTYGEEFLESI